MIHATNCPHLCEVWVDKNNLESYNYKCPRCNGEFQYPAFVPAPGSCTAGTYKCPFCGRIMEGM